MTELPTEHRVQPISTVKAETVRISEGIRGYQRESRVINGEALAKHWVTIRDFSKVLSLVCREELYKRERERLSVSRVLKRPDSKGNHE